MISNSISIKGSGSNPFTLFNSYSESNINIEDNTSDIDIVGYLQSSNSYWSSSINSNIKIYWFDTNEHQAGTEIASLDFKGLPANTSRTVNGKITVKHSSDGSLRGYAKTVYTKGTTTSFAPPSSEVLTIDTALYTIPRASSISGFFGEIEGSVTVPINRASANFAHNVTYQFGTLSGNIATNVIDTFTWIMPASFYTQIPNAERGVGSVTVWTYSGATLLGSYTTNFTALCNPTLCSPELSATYEDTNPKSIALTGDNQKVVLNASKVDFDLTTLTKNGSTLRSLRINGVEIGNVTEFTVLNPITNIFTIVLTDSRGFTKTLVLTADFINYLPLTLNAVAVRNNPTNGLVDLDYSGQYFNDTFGDVANTLAITYKFREYIDGSEFSELKTLEYNLNENKFSKSVTLVDFYDYKKSYEIVVYIEDKLGALFSYEYIYPGIPVYDWNDEKFWFNVETYIQDYKVNANALPIDSSNPFTGKIIPVVHSWGAMEVGKYLDFHEPGSTNDFDGRIYLENKRFKVWGDETPGDSILTSNGFKEIKWTEDGKMKLIGIVGEYYVPFTSNIYNFTMKFNYVEFQSEGYPVRGVNTWDSDIKYKKNITLNKDKALEKLKKIKVKEFDWIEDKPHTKWGVIAQDLEKIEKEFVFEVGEHKNPNYTTLIPFMLKCIQEQQKEIEELKCLMKK